ncbi:MAG: hypothetical protein JRI97_00545 [Deltaproteobacteria bacterium]|nr:hypothetical protein [Deltaproteobacteria bacterium]
MKDKGTNDEYQGVLPTCSFWSRVARERLRRVSAAEMSLVMDCGTRGWSSSPHKMSGKGPASCVLILTSVASRSWN